MKNRYEGKPFLRLLECYVLWSVDQLPPGRAEELEEMAPKLAAAYGADGTWHDIVAAQMEFPSNLPDALQEMWERSLVRAGYRRDEVDPQLWAEQVVDSNFT